MSNFHSIHHRCSSRRSVVKTPPASGSHCSNVRTLFTSPPALKTPHQLEHLWYQSVIFLVHLGRALIKLCPKTWTKLLWQCATLSKLLLQTFKIAIVYINRLSIFALTWEEHPGAPPVFGDELPHHPLPHVLLAPHHQLDSGPDQPGVLRPPPQDEAAEGGAGEEEVAAAAGGRERGRGEEGPGLEK